MVSTDRALINQLLNRGTENIYPHRQYLEDLLLSGKQLKVYCGFDPTAPTLHLGHLIQARKLSHFQALGHQVIMLIGGFTAMVGDPTDKLETRRVLTKEEVDANSRSYVKQFAPVLKFDGDNPVIIKNNYDWHSQMKFEDILVLTAHITVQRLLERDMFQERLKAGKPIYTNEFLYPLMQGYDSVAMDVDGEVGGNDQTYNMLCGRDLMHAYQHKEKFVLTNKLLTDPSGKKMGKSEGNMLKLDDTSRDMFGKIMAQPDSLITQYYELVTTVPLDEIKTMEQAMAAGANPRDYKIALATEIVRMYYGEAVAQAEQDFFIQTFSQKSVSLDDITTEFKITAPLNILDLLVTTQLTDSKSQAKRDILGGGVKIDGHKIEDPTTIIEPAAAARLLQKGKKDFVKLM